MELPTVMQNIGLALLTIFIPVALFLFEKNDESNFKTLDKAVILDNLVDARNLLWKIALIFIPLLFWDIESCIVRTICIVLWIIGVILVTDTLRKSYNWIRNGRFQYRFSYLKKVKTGNELEDLWRSVWEASGTNSQNEIEFFKIFSSLIDTLAVDEENLENLNLLGKLLNDFQIFVKKRSFIFLTAKDDVFQKILEWHFMIWQREYKYMIRKDKLDQFSGYTNISSVLDATIKSVTERALQNEMAYGFFKLMETHVDKHKNEAVIDAPQIYYYLDSLLGVFYNSFFDNIEDARDRYDIWQHYFPKNWFITKQNITNPDNAPVRVTINHFMMLARDRIKLSKKGEMEFDKVLEGISKELFPTVEPSFWAIMFTLLMRPWGDNDRIKTLIEYPRNFGYVGRIYTSWSDGHENQIETKMAESREEEIKRSIDLLLTLFPHEFTKEKINAYIDELEALKYETGSKEQLYKEQVLFYMRKILEVVETKPVK
jgi:hypothetical protein